MRYTNRWPWLVLAKPGPVTYKIQRHPQADPEIVVQKMHPGGAKDARLVDAVRLPSEDMVNYNSPGMVPSTSEYRWI